MSHTCAPALAILLAITAAACATGQKPAAMTPAPANPAGMDHAGMDHEAHMQQVQADERLRQQGAAAMGFDQTATTHHFRLSPQGGAIEVTVKDRGDEVNLTAIRTHLREIASQFAAGDFEKPLMTHGESPDGMAEMAARRDAITYVFEMLPDGGRVRITSADTTAIAAVHQFLQYQIREHKTGDPLTIVK